MPTGIPDKGRVLTDISLRWFRMTGNIFPNHLISTDIRDFPAPVQPFAEQLERRTMWVRKAEVLPVECVVRGYLAGSAWKEYRESGTINGEPMPSGLVESAKLPWVLFTPSTKEESGHDRPIDLDEMASIIGRCVGVSHRFAETHYAEPLRDRSLALYAFGAKYAEGRGFIPADTKFEFGLADGELILVDEVLTPDSSRYWDMASWEPGRPQEAFDKQYVRDFLEGLCDQGLWDKTYPGPVLPDDVVAKTAHIYRACRDRLFGDPSAL
jgi:phosphoribosylaminoimidazole-succinocarboxamide synthase